jgi:hypothetical protein
MHSKSKYAIHKIEAAPRSFCLNGISKAGFLEEEALMKG